MVKEQRPYFGEAPKISTKKAVKQILEAPTKEKKTKE